MSNASKDRKRNQGNSPRKVPRVIFFEDRKKNLTPLDVRDLILSILSIENSNKKIVVENASSIKKLVILFLDGLDRSRLIMHSEVFPDLNGFNDGGYPVLIQANAKSGYIFPVEQTLLGYTFSPKEKVKYSSLEEMVIDEFDLIDNGYPLPANIDRSKFNGVPRYQHFDVQLPTDEEMTKFSELPDHVDGALDVVAIDCEMVEIINEFKQEYIIFKIGK